MKTNFDNETVDPTTIVKHVVIRAACCFAAGVIVGKVYDLAFINPLINKIEEEQKK
jgi:hypothetical protein